MSEAKPKQESIHPRVYHTDGVKLNTNRKKNKDVTKRKIANMEAHLERHPRDASTQRHISTLQATL